MTDRIEQQVRQAFPEGAITRAQVPQYGDDPEVEPGHTAMRVFFDWPGRSEGGQANPKTLHQFVTANVRALDVLRDELPLAIGWVEFRPEDGPRGGQPSWPVLPDQSPTADGRPPRATKRREDRTPVMVRLGLADLATVDTLIAAGVVSSRAEGLRWILRYYREDPAYARLQQQAHQDDEPTT